VEVKNDFLTDSFPAAEFCIPAPQEMMIINLEKIAVATTSGQVP
jgi:hypothetical protein